MKAGRMGLSTRDHQEGLSLMLGNSRDETIRLRVDQEKGDLEFLDDNDKIVKSISAASSDAPRDFAAGEAGDLRRLAYACLAYANHRDGRLPARWSQIHGPYLKNDVEAFISPREKRDISAAVREDVDKHGSYILVAGLKATDPPDWILAYSRDAGPDGRHRAARVDARTTKLTPKELEDRLAKQRREVPK